MPQSQTPVGWRVDPRCGAALAYPHRGDPASEVIDLIGSYLTGVLSLEVLSQRFRAWRSRPALARGQTPREPRLRFCFVSLASAAPKILTSNSRGSGSPGLTAGPWSVNSSSSSAMEVLSASSILGASPGLSPPEGCGLVHLISCSSLLATSFEIVTLYRSRLEWRPLKVTLPSSAVVTSREADRYMKLMVMPT